MDDQLLESPSSLPMVHTMWLGTKLSRLEVLTLKSFVCVGHRVVLWAYDDISHQVPKTVEVRDAESILPRATFRPKALAEPALGVSAGSIGGVYSDLFRYRVLYEHGGLWADMDVTALRPFEMPADYVFRPHKLGIVGNIMKCPRGSSLMMRAYEETEKIASAYTPWLRPIEILNDLVRRLELENFRVENLSNRDRWAEVLPFISGVAPIPSSWCAIHWMNERWRTILQDGDSSMFSKNDPPAVSTLSQLYLDHEVELLA